MAIKIINWLIRKTLFMSIPEGKNRKERRDNNKMLRRLSKKDVKYMELKNLRTFDDYQLHVMIKRGKYVEEVKREWRGRYNLEYPFRANMKGEIERIY